MDYFVIAVTLGSVYALIGLGYALIYSCLRLINFAHGEFCAVAAYSACFATTALGLGPMAAVCFGVFAGAAIAVITWHVAYRPLRFAGRASAILAALGVSICLQQALARAFGAQSRPFPPLLGERPVQIGAVQIDSVGLFCLVSAGLVLVAVHVLWRHSRLGLLIRAVADDRESAEAAGISADRVTIATFLAAGASAGIAGIVLASSFGRVEPTMGFAPAVKAFVAALVGGLRDPRGAAAGGLLLGFAETLAVAAGLSAYRDAVVLSLLVVLLLIRARTQIHVITPPAVLAEQE